MPATTALTEVAALYLAVALELKVPRQRITTPFASTQVMAMNL